MARPSRGVLAPLLFRLPPGTGGRRRGTGEDMLRSVSGLSGFANSWTPLISGRESEAKVDVDRESNRTSWSLKDVVGEWVSDGAVCWHLKGLYYSSADDSIRSQLKGPVFRISARCTLQDYRGLVLEGS